MEIKRIIVGQIEANCYLIISNNELVVVDPGDEAEKIITEIEKLPPRHSRGGGNPDLRVIPKYILLTHGHFDHVGAVKELKKKYGFEIVIGEKDKDITDLNMQIGVQVPEIKADILLKDGQILDYGNEEIQVFETPGHTAGSVSYLVENNLFSGDTLFRHTHGRTDLPGGSDEEMKKSLEKLLKLEKEIKIFPGHGSETTIKDEKEYFRGAGVGI